MTQILTNAADNGKSFLAAGVVTMSSREIAELTGKRHDNVKRLIDDLINSDVILEIPQFEEIPTATKPVLVYHLKKRETLIVVARLSPEFTAAVVDRWQELEAQVTAPAKVELSRMDILQIAMQAEQERLVAVEQRDEAIRTKAEIGSRREATAMATAAAAKRETYMLKEQLGYNANHATVITVEKALKRKFPTNAYVGLRKWCKANGVTPKDVTDPRYGQVKAWPAAAWMEVYGVDLVEVNGGAA